MKRNATEGIMYIPMATPNAPMMEFMGPKNGRSRAKKHMAATTGMRARIRRKNALVCTPTAFSQSRKTGCEKSTKPAACM